VVAPIDPALARWSSGYGVRVRHGHEDLHTGADLLAPIGTPIYAVAPGVVRVVAQPGELRGYGRVVVLDHGQGRGFTLYAHLSAAHVTKGQAVAEGQQIALSGASGDRSEFDVVPHLHFEWLSRWPPRGRDLDRADPTVFLGRFGYRGRAAPPQIATVRPAQPRSAPASFVAQPSRIASSGAGIALLFAAIMLHRRRRPT